VSLSRKVAWALDKLGKTIFCRTVRTDIETGAVSNLLSTSAGFGHECQTKRETDET